MAHILIVEDEEAINRLIRQNLSLAGHTCEQIYDGAKAKRMLLSGKPFDLIIMDVMLPCEDGFSLMQYTGSIPVIFLTASGDEDDVMNAIRLGAVNYLKKPFMPNALLDRVEKELEQ